MNKRPKRLIKPPPSLKEYVVVAEIEGEDEGRENSSELKVHTRRLLRHNNSILKCKKCDTRCKNRSELINHIKKHKGKENFLCEDCGKSLKSFQAFSEHMNIHKNIKPYKCEICGHESRQMSVHSRHLLTHEKNPAQTFKCSVCSKPFKQKEYLKQHMRKHVGEKPYECDQCSKFFTAKTELNRHKISHSSNRPFSCQHCNKRFKLKHNLNAHIKAHTGMQLWKCCLCKASFPQQCLMEKHKKSHTEVIQHLELVKTDQRTLTITSFPLDRRKVLHHQKVSLPAKLDLNDSKNAFNSKVSLALNDAFIPISVIANSFGTGNYIKMKIVEQINFGAENSAKKFADMNGVTNALLVDEESVLSEGGEEEEITAIMTDISEPKLSNSNGEELESEGSQIELPIVTRFRSHFDLFEKTFSVDCLDDAKVTWLQMLTDIVKEFNFPLEQFVSQQLHLVIVRLQNILITNSLQLEKHIGSTLDLHAPSCESFSLSSVKDSLEHEGNENSSIPHSNESDFRPLANEDSKNAEKPKSRVQLCDSKETENEPLKKGKLREIHKSYLILLEILQKHFKVILER